MANEGAIASTSTAGYHQARGFSTLIKGLCSSIKNMHPEKKKKKKKPALSCAQHAPIVHSMHSKSKGFDCVFHYFDENGDGKISPGELRGCMKELLSLEEAEAVVQSADSDGDGLLGFDDFVMLVDARGEEERGRSLKEAFQVYEVKDRGCITAESLRKALRRLGESRSVEECRVMIQKFDANGDGVISFEEFREMMI